MANLYYDERLGDENFAVGMSVEIGGEEARHALRVARLRVGERIRLGNGTGAIGTGEVTEADRESFRVLLEEVRIDAPPVRPLVLVQALAKGDRDERAVEQATEFGVDCVVPWQAERSVSRWSTDEKAVKGQAKWERIAREASKQSLRSRIPAVLPLAETETVAGLALGGALVLVLHPDAELTLGSAIRTALIARPDGGSEGSGVARGGAAGLAAEASDSTVAAELRAGVILVVGPEGGITDRELSAFERSGARIVRLGETVLRASSAGPAALAVLHGVLGEW